MNGRAARGADLGVLSDCAHEVAAAFVSLASDIAVVVDGRGVVTGVALSPAAPLPAGAEDWIGRPWTDTVTGGTRRKIELMLADVALTGVARRREVNLPADEGEIPVAYTAMRLGSGGPVIAVGRDLREVAASQQRFLDVQQQMERSYWRARQLESRYRQLFQLASDAAMTVEAQSQRVVEANHAAARLFEGHDGPLAGAVTLSLFDPASRPALQRAFADALASGLPVEMATQVAGGAAVSVSATPFRARDGMRLLLRLRPQSGGAKSSGDLSLALARLVDTTRDGIVVTGPDGHVVVANPAFVAMVGVATETQLRGRLLSDWLGRIPQDVPALIAGVHGHGLAQLVRTQLRPEPGRDPIDVDVAAALISEGDPECFGFTLRECAPASPAADEHRRQRLGQAMAALETSLDDPDVPRGELMRHAERLAQAHLAECALARCGRDVRAAATMLGIDPQALRALESPQQAHTPAPPATEPSER